LLPFDYNKLKAREIDLESHVSKRAGEAASSLAGWTLPGQALPTPG
jgi:hypothetical protein